MCRKFWNALLVFPKEKIPMKFWDEGVRRTNSQAGPAQDTGMPAVRLDFSSDFHHTGK